MAKVRRGLKSKGWLAWGLILIWLGGCGPSALEMDYGRSVRNNIAQQLVNPQAGLEARPSTGLDPRAGQNVMERYDKSFKEKETPTPVIQPLTTAK
jgi:hypothetical protein